MTPGPVTPGPHDDLTDVAGVRVGHFQRDTDGWLTGTTVVLLPAGTVGGVDVRGGGPCTRETDALAPGTLVEEVHAICLSGGSVYGLAAAGGVTDWLGEHAIGLPVGPEAGQVAPIVPAAGLFDLRAGAFDRRPDAAFGRAAAEAAAATAGAGPVPLGNAGAGAGARAGALKGGIGSASARLPAGPVVAALVTVNSAGGVVDAATGELWGARHARLGDTAGLRAPAASEVASARDAGSLAFPAPAPRSTVLVVVATDAGLLQPECTRVAIAAQDGIARAVTPAHGLTDGDVVFCVATRRHPLPAAPGEGETAWGTGSRPGALGAVMAAAADTVTRAIVRAVLHARGVPGLPAYRDLFPSAMGG